MREFLRARFTSSDLLRLVSSLVLALLHWGWVTAREDPQTTRTYRNITVTVGELRNNLVVVSAQPNAVVTLTGPRSVMNTVDVTAVGAHLALNGITKPGPYTVAVVVSAPSGVWQRRATPSQVQIQVEQSVPRQFTIVPTVQGDVGSRRRVGQIQPNPSEVTVRGPSSVVDHVVEVVLPITIGNQTHDFSADFTPVALDKDGQQVTAVTISPATITTTVPIAAAGKSIAVFAQLVGAPAQGLDVLDRAVDPATVLVDGPADQLDSLVVVQTQPIDITGATGNVSRRVPLAGLPSGVHVNDPADGQVAVYIQIGPRGVRQVLPGLKVEATNLGPGLTAEMTPGEVTVVVVASADLLQRLTADDLMIQVDLAGLGPGEHVLKPAISLPPNVQWISTDPATVMVTIRPAHAPAAASPVASPVPAG